MDTRMNFSQNCVAITKQFEGCQLTSYQDPAGVWTIGYGHTGAEVREGLTIDQGYADRLLMMDLLWAQKVVNDSVKAQLNQNQFDALCDFVFNCGSSNFRSSTLLKLINNEKFDEAVREFAKWNKSRGKVLPGLTARRAAEAALFAKA